MKKGIVWISMCMGLMLAMAGCGAEKAAQQAVDTCSTPVTDSSMEESAVVETSVVETSVEEVSQPLVETEWKVVSEQSYDFKVYISGYNTAEHGVTVGYGGEIHSTTDTGANWPKSPNNSACLFTLDFVDDNIVYASGNQGNVTKSTDGGKNFSVVGSFIKAKSIDISFMDENNGIVATIDKLGITNDGGVTWTEVEHEGTISCILMVSADEFYYITKDLIMNKTVDGGKTWEVIPLNLPLGDKYFFGPQSIQLYVDGEDSYTIYCIQMGEKKLRCYGTTDKCTSWTEYAMPEVTGSANFYLNHEGDVLTYYLYNDVGAIVLTK